MRLSDCRTMDDVIKYLQYRWQKQNMYLVEVEQVHNILIVTYWKPVEEEKKKEEKDKILIYTTKIKKDNEIPMWFTRIKVDLAKLIEPYKSKKAFYDKMWAEAQNLENVEEEV